MAFTEFTCRSGGNNLYAGSLDGSAEASTTPLVTYASGSWVNATGVFTPASGNPVSAGVAVGQFASVYPDGTTGSTVFVGRITAVSATTITVSLTAKSGTAPADGTSNRTLVVGGAWQGPNGTVAFPFGFATSSLTNSGGNLPRVNLKNDQTYSVSAAMSHNNAGVGFQGYSSSFGDGGKATIDGGGSGASYIVLSCVPGANPAIRLVDLDFYRNGSTGSANGVELNGNVQAVRCSFRNMKGSGVKAVNNSGSVVLSAECEAYSNGSHGFDQSGNNSTRHLCLRCVAHGNTGNGFNFTNTVSNDVSVVGCVAAANGGVGFSVCGGQSLLLGCDAYANTSHGFQGANNAQNANYWIENCNFASNGGWGITGNGIVGGGFVYNCGFGAGTKANTSGTINTSDGGIKSWDVSGTVTYASGATPWVDPDNGDFRISLAAAKGAGRGGFQASLGGWTGATVGYPDIGAAQALAAGGPSSRGILTGGRL